MIELGWLSPSGEMHECGYMEHMAVAQDLAEKLGWHELDENMNRVHADDFLMQHGWVHITRSAFFGHEYFLLHDKHYTQAQKDWLKPRVEENWEWIEKLSQMEWEEENE